MYLIKTVSRKRGTLIRDVLALLLLGAICLFGAAETPEQQAQDFSSQYGIILERNIFSRYRGQRTAAARRQDDGPAGQPSLPSPESYFVLRGLAREDDAFVALFEDTRSGDVVRVMTEDVIAGGKVTKLTLDSAVYQRDGNTVSVNVGQTLEGKLGATILTVDSLLEWPQTESAASDTQSVEDTNTPSADEAEILKQLMERRRQELGD